jgi:hypothetical protein
VAAQLVAVKGFVDGRRQHRGTVAVCEPRITAVAVEGDTDER